ncbi:MAG: M28 family peptidase [Ferruginibacter sp.]|nr:M28 family peptidase [Chitinophagaceae bacterium]
MKTVFSILCVSFLLTAQAQSEYIDSFITMESVKHTVSALSHDSMKGRFTAMPESEKAAQFIAGRFEKAGLLPVSGNKGYFSYYPIRYEEANESTLVQGINVMAVIPGNFSPDTMVIFCAHFDHLRVKQNTKGNQDSIYNGANDNASGVAVLIELARYYKATQNNRYTLLFIAFSGEELGLLGSKYVASDIDQSFIKTVINFDMLGRPIDGSPKKCMVITDRNDGIIQKLNNELKNKKRFFIDDLFPLSQLFSRSDHYSFTHVKNRIFFTSGSDFDLYYHSLKDEHKTIDFDFLLNVIHNIASCCKIFIN